ncbi:hypothetical protein PT2222_100011 [Paraburkholderia tropica]
MPSGDGPRAAGRCCDVRREVRGLRRHAHGFLDRLFEDRERFVEHVVLDRQREQEAHDVRVHAANQQQQAAVQRGGLHALREVGVGVARARLAEFDGVHRARAAHVGDLRHFRLHRVELGLELVAELRGALAELFFFDDLDHRVRRRHGQRVARVRAAEAAGRCRVHDFRAADHARQRHAAGQALGDRHEVRRDVVVFHREQLAGAREARLHFVGDQQDAVRVADLAQAAHEVRRRLVEAAFALNRFEDDRGDALRIDVGLEQHLDVLERVGRADAVDRVGVRRVVDVGRERTEVQLVRRDLAGERHAHHRAAVETAREGDHARTAGRGARDLDGVFDGFRAGREERGLLREAARCARGDLFGQRDVRLVRHDLVGGVREAVELRLDGGDDLRMAVARVAHGDAGGEVDDAAAFDVPQFRVFSALGVEVAHDAHAARRDGVLAALQIGVLAHVHLLHKLRFSDWLVDRQAVHGATILTFGSKFQSHSNKFIGANFDACECLVRLAGPADRARQRTARLSPVAPAVAAGDPVARAARGRARAVLAAAGGGIGDRAQYRNAGLRTIGARRLCDLGDRTRHLRRRYVPGRDRRRGGNWLCRWTEKCVAVRSRADWRRDRN